MAAQYPPATAGRNRRLKGFKKMEHARIHISGIVQGVGFRPFVYNLATRLGLSGYCLNDSEGVVIEVHGKSIEHFIRALKETAPPLSMIEELTVTAVTPASTEGEGAGFHIRKSVSEAGKSVLVSPDIAVCADCLREMNDPGDRRHLYPFINCTNCGPRYTIIRDIPYDRPFTTMAPFDLCEDCAIEYHDPSNRRFHAQPNACERCGPVAWLTEKYASGPMDGRRNFAAVTEAARLLKEGAILAIKGIGGFHLACDAENKESVRRLRASKRCSLTGAGRRGSNKPFAVMAPDTDSVKRFAKVSGAEQILLEGMARPIVLLEKLLDDALAKDVAPGSRHFGAMLPYAPLHHLLFRSAGFNALVMTSGNMADEPIAISNEEAIKKLSTIADCFLLHDRAIYMRADDSIARVDGCKTRMIRRARGYAPVPIDLHSEVSAPECLAFGAELKNTFCITKGRRAIMSTHIGDMKNFEEVEFFNETLANLKKTFRLAPAAIALDMHPDYLSTRLAREYASLNGIPAERVVPVQHHHGHIASCMAEHGLKGTVIGVALDGTGLGSDGNIWGGEFLAASMKGFTRSAHLEYIPLPGGDTAIKEPWRMALSYLLKAYPEGLSPETAPGFFSRLSTEEVGVVTKMIQGSINSPLTSSMGRLFDAVSSLVGLRDTITYEAEAAIVLEAVAKDGATGYEPYPFEIFKIKDGAPLVISGLPVIRAVVDGVNKGVGMAEISARFHATVARMTTDTAKKIRQDTGLDRVVLSGGVFQNRLLSRLTEASLTQAGFIVFSHEKVPANDGGISLGQAAIALEKLKGE